MYSAEQWVDHFKLNPEHPLKEVRAIQADALRFAAMHYIGAASLNEAGIRLESLAAAIENGHDLGEFMEVLQYEGGEKSTGNTVRAYAQKRD